MNFMERELAVALLFKNQLSRDRTLHLLVGTEKEG